MKIKNFLVLVYGLAGLFIASITAFMTFVIIEKPVGCEMGSKIILTVLLTMPVIIFISFIIGRVLSKNINIISTRLENILNGEYSCNSYHSQSIITEVSHISEVSNKVASEINELMCSLKQKNEELTMMLLTLSHDIRTPLTIANGYIEELEDNMISQEKLPAVYRKLKEENNFINELCNEVINYEHSKAPYIRINEPVLIKPLANQVIDLLNSKVINNIDSSLSLKFNVIDLKKVLINLLQNALKHSDSKEIFIYNQDEKIIVEDFGIGIGNKNFSNLFNPFYTVDNSKNRDKNGFGLGLAIAKNLCNRNEFLIEYDANFNDGARFIIFQKKQN